MLDLVLVSLPDWVSANPKMYFPLSLLYVGAMAHKEGYKVRIVDFRDRAGQLPEARYYGFTSATPQISVAKELAISAKTQYPNAKTVIGGAHASLLPGDCLGFFDHIVKGEGEYAILDILKGKGNTFMQMPRILNLDDVPFPAWDMIADPFSETLFPGERYGTGEKAMTIIGSRGCPYSCSFCGNIHQVPVIYRSSENIVEELKELQHRGIRHFRFEDDNFTVHPNFTRLCLEVGKLGIRYKCHTRSKLLTENMARLMKESGCEECGLGVESADNKVLVLNNKKELAEDHKQAIEILHLVGLRAKTYFVAGLPGEDNNTLYENMKFIKETKPDKWTLSTFTPYPGCPVYDDPAKYGIKIIDENFANWWNYVPDHFNHIIKGQTAADLWQRYVQFYEFLKGEEWR